jgi:ABC-type transporter Mla maintaining outer membrane lipid asymmetry ATPase subunit MlaF
MMLTSHKDKYEYLENYILDKLDDDGVDVSRPLMIIGDGGSGKSTVIAEIMSKYNKYNYSVIIPHEKTYITASKEEEQFHGITFIHAWPEPECEVVAKYLRANIVYFERDPAKAYTY